MAYISYPSKLSPKENRDIFLLLRKIRTSTFLIAEASADKLFNVVAAKPPLSPDFYAGDISPLGQSVNRSDVNPEIIGDLLYRKDLSVHSNPPSIVYHKFRSYLLMYANSNIYTINTTRSRKPWLLFCLKSNTSVTYWNY